MSISDRREREKTQRRNTIIDAAETLFFSKGFANTTMDEVAEIVELSKGTLYLYFKSKEELYVALIQRAMDILKEMFKTAAGTPGNGLTRIAAVGMAFYDFYKKYPFHFQVLFHRELNNSILNKDNPQLEDLMMQGEEMFQLAVNIIKDGVTDGSIRPGVDPYKTALALDGIFTGLLRVVSLEENHLMKYHNVSPGELIDYFFDLIGHALTGSNTYEGPPHKPLSTENPGVKGRKPRNKRRTTDEV
ncbi:MAG TPA: TetR/AcrR family transcriptional regulator [Candidatus Deferrimicrobium sp.]|nr:TetR/AcrR family transcriptional regulator [Candidatus Deferrimicrobium sp.]